MNSNVDILVSMGVFDISGMKPTEVGRLEKNTRTQVRYPDNPSVFNQGQLYIHIVQSGEYVGKQHDPSSKYPYRVVTESGAYLDIPKLAYNALVMPEIGS